MARKEHVIRQVPQDEDVPASGRPPAARLHLWQIVAVQDLFWMLLAAGTIAVIFMLRSIFLPVVVALILAYLFNPSLSYVEKHWRIRRTLGSLAAVGLTIGLCYGVLAWLGPVVVEQIQTLADKAPGYLEQLTGRHGVRIGSVPEHLSRLFSQMQEDPVNTLSGTGQAVGVIGFVLGKVSNLLIDIIVVPIYLFFFCAYYDRMTRALFSILRERRKERILDLCRQMDEAVSGFVRGRFLIAGISMVLFLFAFAMVDLPYWSLLGVITGVLTLIPYVSLVGWPLAVGLKYLDLTTSGDQVSWMAVMGWPSLAYAIPAFIEGWILTPWIQSNSMEMSVMTILLVLFIGGAIGGAFGVFVAIPVAACLKILMQELMLPRIRRWAREH